MLVLRASAHTGSQQPASAPAPESATDAEAVKVVEAVKALETKVKELTEQLEAVKQLEGDEAPWQGQTRQRRKRKQARAGPGMRARARARSGAATFLMTSAAWRPRRIGTFLDKGMGYVLVDVRPSGEVDPRVQMTLQMLVFEHNVRAARWVRLRRGSGAALWVSASMSAKVPPLVHELATVRSLPEGVNSLIGKAYALLHSPFNISVRLSPQVDVPTPQPHGTAHPRRCSSTATAGSAQTGGPSCRRPLLLRPRHALFLRYTGRPRRHHALCSSSSPRAASPTSRRRHQP